MAAVGVGDPLEHGHEGLGAAAAAATASATASVSSGLRPRLVQAAPLLLIAALVFQRGATDALTWYTRARGAAYSGSSVALLSELLKYPVTACTVALLESPTRVWPMLRGALTESPLAMAWVGAAYAAQNVLYFLCLRHISAVGYQLLSQTKIVFAAVLLRVFIQKRLSWRQCAALVLLMAGAAMTQLGESCCGLSGEGGSTANVALGSALTVLSAFLSTLPNAFYERLIKSGKDKSKWVLNVQLITWTIIWVWVIKLLTGDGLAAAQSGVGAGEGGVTGLVRRGLLLTHGFTPAVWLIALLKSLNCILVPLCLKYADNVLYGYVKPASTILTCTVTGILASSLPEPLMLGGIVLVFSSLALYAKG